MLAKQSDIALDYQNQVYALNPDLNPYAQGGDYWVRSQVLGGVLSGVYLDIMLKFLNVFPQNSYSFYVDKWLASLSLPPRHAAFPAKGSAVPNVAPTSNTVIPAGTTMTYAGSVPLSYVFVVDQTTTIPAGQIVPIPITSQNLGVGTSVGVNSILKSTPTFPDIDSFTVTYMADGSDEETDDQALARVLYYFQYPPEAASVGYYKKLALQVPLVTDAFILNNINNQNIVGIYVLSGGGNLDQIANDPNSYPYTRTASPQTIQNTKNYIEINRNATSTTYVSSVETYLIPNVVKVAVELGPNLTLQTFLPQYNMTVELLIKREVRRAILKTPIGGHRVNTVPYLFVSDITDGLGIGLGSKENLKGLYATLLLDWEVTLVGGTPNFELPTSQLSSGNFPYIYDIPYSNITVSLVTD